MESANLDASSGLIQLGSGRGIFDWEWIPVLVVQPSRRDWHLERITVAACPYQRIAPHFEYCSFHANAIHADGLGIRVTFVVRLPAHFEGVILRDVAGNASAVVFDCERFAG